MAATVTIGFVKDAKHHIDIQGFNIYHKNRLIKVFYYHSHIYDVYTEEIELYIQLEEEAGEVSVF